MAEILELKAKQRSDVVMQPIWVVSFQGVNEYEAIEFPPMAFPIGMGNAIQRLEKEVQWHYDYEYQKLQETSGPDSYKHQLRTRAFGAVLMTISSRSLIFPISIGLVEKYFTLLPDNIGIVIVSVATLITNKPAS